MTTTRTFEFICEATGPKVLANDVTIALALTPLDPELLFQSQFPVSWKVFTFQKGQSKTAQETYTAKIGFSSAQMDSGNRVTPGADRGLAIGQKLTYETEDRWSGPTFGESGFVEAFNNAPGPAPTLAVGLYDDENPPRFSPILASTVNFQDIFKGKFTPSLFAYVVEGKTQVSTLFKAAVQTTAGPWNIVSDFKEGTVPRLLCYHDATSGAFTVDLLN